jgi:hypothetical protein
MMFMLAGCKGRIPGRENRIAIPKEKAPATDRWAPITTKSQLLCLEPDESPVPT